MHIVYYRPSSNRHVILWSTFMHGIIYCNNYLGCLKITEDKSWKSRIQTLDVRLIIATNAGPRREGWNQRLNITARTKTRGLKPASQHYCGAKTQNPKPASHVKLDTELEIRVSQALLQQQNARLKTCVSVITVLISRSITAHVMRELTPIMECF